MFCRFHSETGSLLTDKLMGCIYLILKERWQIFPSFKCYLPSTDYSQHSRNLSVSLYILHAEIVNDTTEESPWIHPYRIASTVRQQRDSQNSNKKRNQTKTNSFLDFVGFFFIFFFEKNSLIKFFLMTSIVEVFLTF